MKRVKCIGCDNKVNPPFTVCKSCAYKDETRRSLGIGIAADYQLGDDPVLNGLCFLHACGVLSAFIENTYSGVSAFIDSAKPLSFVSEDDVDEFILSMYDESTGNGVERRFFDNFGWRGGRL